MNPVCSHCGKPSPGNAKFCLGCGSSLGATHLQGQTILNSPVAVPAGAGQVIPIPKPGVRESDTVAPPFPAPSIPPPAAAQREEITMVTDVSGSMGERYDGRFTKLQAVIRAGISMIVEKYHVDPNDEVGLVRFNRRGEVVFPIYPLVTYKPQLIQAVQSLTHGGGTDINEGLKTARGLFDWSRMDVVRRIILLTDGQGGHPLSTAEDLKHRGVVIDVVGVGDQPGNVNEKLLKAVASTVQGELRYRFIKDQKTLVDEYTKLAGKTVVAT